MLNQLMELKDAFKKFAHNEGYLQLKLEAQ